MTDPLGPRRVSVSLLRHRSVPKPAQSDLRTKAQSRRRGKAPASPRGAGASPASKQEADAAKQRVREDRIGAIDSFSRLIRLGPMGHIVNASGRCIGRGRLRRTLLPEWRDAGEADRSAPAAPRSASGMMCARSLKSAPRRAFRPGMKANARSARGRLNPSRPQAMNSRMAIVVWNPKMTFASAPLRLPISSGKASALADLRAQPLRDRRAEQRFLDLGWVVGPGANFLKRLGFSAPW